MLLANLEREICMNFVTKRPDGASLLGKPNFLFWNKTILELRNVAS